MRDDPKARIALPLNSGALADAAARAPATAGVYYLLDEHDVLIYVGQTGNLRRRLQQHAKAARTAASPRDAARDEVVAAVRWEECASEEAAAGRETDLIVAFQPLLNASQATDGRWVYVNVVPQRDRGTVRFELTAAAARSRSARLYGCFAHI